MHRLKRLVPAALQLTRDEPIGRIDAVVLPARMGSLVASLGECQLELPLSGRHFGGLSFERLNRSVDAERLENAQTLLVRPRPALPRRRLAGTGQPVELANRCESALPGLTAPAR